MAGGVFLPAVVLPVLDCEGEPWYGSSPLRKLSATELKHCRLALQTSACRGGAGRSECGLLILPADGIWSPLLGAACRRTVTKAGAEDTWTSGDPGVPSPASGQAAYGVTNGFEGVLLLAVGTAATANADATPLPVHMAGTRWPGFGLSSHLSAWPCQGRSPGSTPCDIEAFIAPGSGEASGVLCGEEPDWREDWRACMPSVILCGVRCGEQPAWREDWRACIPRRDGDEADAGEPSHKESAAFGEAAVGEAAAAFGEPLRGRASPADRELMRWCRDPPSSVVTPAKGAHNLRVISAPGLGSAPQGSVADLAPLPLPAEVRSVTSHCSDASLRRSIRGDSPANVRWSRRGDSPARRSVAGGE